MANIQIIRSDGLARIQGTAPKQAFRDAQRSYKQAELKVDNTSSFHFDLAGFRIELNFAGPALHDFILPAINHLSVEANQRADLTIFLWDFDSTRVGIPNTLFESENFDDELIESPRILNLMDEEPNVGLYWSSDPEMIPYFERGAPLRAIFHWWMKAKGMQIVHAGAVGLERKGVLLVGGGGSGKSTTSLACINAGLDYLGDDNCLVVVNPAPKAFSLYSTLKLNWDNVPNFNNLPAPLDNSSGVEMEKALFFLDEYRPQRMARELDLKAILIPKVTNKTESRVMPASLVDGLKSLGPSTIVQMPSIEQNSLREISTIVKSLPVRYLELGSDLAGVANTVAEFIQQAK